MNQYDMRCPVCGKMNHQLLLEETDGWMDGMRILRGNDAAAPEDVENTEALCLGKKG